MWRGARPGAAAGGTAGVSWCKGGLTAAQASAPLSRGPGVVLRVSPASCGAQPRPRPRPPGWRTLEPFRPEAPTTPVERRGCLPWGVGHLEGKRGLPLAQRAIELSLLAGAPSEVAGLVEGEDKRETGWMSGWFKDGAVSPFSQSGDCFLFKLTDLLEQDWMGWG